MTGWVIRVLLAIIEMPRNLINCYYRKQNLAGSDMRLNFLHLFVISLMLAHLYSSEINAQHFFDSSGVVVIGAKGNSDSEQLLQYYRSERGIPEEQTVLFDFPGGDVVPREVWEEELRPKIRNWLNRLREDKGLKVNGIVLLRGVPMIVEAWPDDSIEQVFWEESYSRMIEHWNKRSEKLVRELANLGTESEPDFSNISDATSMAKLFETVAGKVQSKIVANKNGQESKLQSFQQAIRELAGTTPFLNGLRQQLQGSAVRPPELIGQYEKLSGIRQGQIESLNQMERLPVSVDREWMIANIVSNREGALGAWKWLEKQRQMIAANQSKASLDSELTLIASDNYRRIGTTPIDFNQPGASVLPVRRIDGPTLEVARDLIKRAKVAEKSPSAGKVYIDRRGLTNGSIEDMALENWLQQIEQQFSLAGREVQSDDSPQLFSDNACPNAAVYLGWYSLGNYKPSCKFVAGAVAYHLVPEDAQGVHLEDDNGWCKGLLNEGATFVIGSVSEPGVVDFSEIISGDGKQVFRAFGSDGIVVFGDFTYLKR